MKLSNFQYDKEKYRIHTWKDSAFKGTVVNLALSKFGIKITLTVSLSQSVLKFNLKT